MLGEYPIPIRLMDVYIETNKEKSDIIKEKTKTKGN